MASLNRIRTDGFKRWYERQLIECHLWLVTWFLGVITLVSGIEVAGAGPDSRIVGASLLLGGLAVTVLSWTRYRLLLLVAERLGEQAVCPKCKVYGKFKVHATWPTDLPDGGNPQLEKKGDAIWLRAHCSQCGEEWILK